MEVCPFVNQHNIKKTFKFIPPWTIQLLLPQWHRLEIKAGLMFGEDTEGSGPMDAHTGED